MTIKGETYSKDWTDEHAVVLAEGVLVTLGKGGREFLSGVGLATLQGLEGKIKATII